MMFSLEKVLQSIQIRKLSSSRKKLTNARRDWGLVLGSFLALLLLFILWSIYFFFQVQSGNLFVETTTPPSFEQPLSKERIDNALLLYQDEKANYDALILQRPDERDPSK